MTKFEHQDSSWSPQPGPQDDLLTCPLQEIFFGGARGGGKTDGVLGKWAAKERMYGQHFNAIMFRRTAVSAEDAVERSKEIYRPIGGRFNESKLRWRMPNGGRVSFAYLDTIADANVYQGRNVTDAWVEEAGQYPSATAIDRLFGILRSSHGVPIQLILTANPGGPGQHWIRERYQIHPFPLRPKIMIRQMPNGKQHQVAVIPSRITDNKILLANDPGYVDRLQLVGSPALVRAWLEGDWSAIEGAFFTEWSEEKHVVTPFAIPHSWLRFRAADWGSYSPFSIGWWAVATDDYAPGGAGTLPDDGALFGTRANLLGTNLLRSADAGVSGRQHLEQNRGDDRRTDAGENRTVDTAGTGRFHAGTKTIPRGALVHYREWYGEVGGKLTAEQVGGGIAEREKGDRPRLSYGVLDPSAFIESGGPSIAERINKTLIDNKMAAFRPADNRRVPRNIGDRTKSGPMAGWDQMRARLKGIDGVPMLYVFDTCRNLIRTLPVMQHDDVRSEDLDCWVAGTMVATPSGDRPIETIKVGDLVETPVGPRPVLRSYLSGTGGTMRIWLSDGRELQGTPRHKIYIRDRGLTPLGELLCHDIPIGRIMSWQEKMLSIAAWFTHAMKAVATTIHMDGSCKKEQLASIVRFGLMPDGKFSPVGMFTTSMVTSTTTNLEILSACHRARTEDFIFKNGLVAGWARDLQSGDQAVLGSGYSAIMPVRCMSARQSVNRRAALVTVLLKHDTLVRFFARKSAPLRASIGRLKKLAQFAARHFGLNVTAPRKSEPVHIIAVGHCVGETQVYNLTVADAHLFYANGVLSSNTESEDHAVDAARYACMSRPWVRAMPKTLLPPRDSYRPAHEERDDSDSVLLL